MTTSRAAGLGLLALLSGRPAWSQEPVAQPPRTLPQRPEAPTSEGDPVQIRPVTDGDAQLHLLARPEDAPTRCASAQSPKRASSHADEREGEPSGVSLEFPGGVLALSAAEELSLELGEDLAQQEWLIAPALGASFSLGGAWAGATRVGLEVRNYGAVVEGELRRSLLFGGPTLSWEADSLGAEVYWAPQLQDLLQGGTDTGSFHAAELRIALSLAL